MIKILLVDDESWVRASIKNKLSWDDNLTICAEASDGYEAVQLAVNLRPDIVVTDVRMPDMSGIEMLSRIREFLPDVQSVIISGYNEFDYVKSAIELGASGYVLKPIHKEELRETILRAVRRIEENALVRRTTQTQLELMHKFLESWYNRLPVDPDRFLKVMRDLKFYSDYMYVVLIRFLAPERSEEVVRQELSEAAAFLSYDYTCTVFPVGRDILGIFLTSGTAVELVAYSRSLIRRLSRKNSLDASAALGTCARRLEELPLSFRTAQESLTLMHLYISHEIILPSKDPAGRLSDPLPKEIAGNLMDSIYSHNLSSLSEALGHLEQFFRSTGSLTLSDEKHILHLLLGDIVRILYEQNWPRELADQGIALMNTVSAYRAGTDILNDFFSYCRRVASSVSGQASISSSVLRAQQYIRAHYQEDVTLKKTAALFYMNASYFSTSFKNITGKNFNEYLTEVRIENAKRLLAKGELRVNQISRLVGYEDCSYFGKIFRRLTGQTPAEYRQQKEEGV